MAEIKKQPSLPSNYVTLAQLQERWLNEQQQKQKQKQKQKQIEEEQERKKEERERKREDEENQKRNEIISNSVSIGRRPILKNRPNRSEKNHRFREVGVSKSVVPEIVEEQRKEREKEEEENQKRNVITNNTVSIDLRPMLRNRRIRSEKNRRFVEVGVSKSVVPEIVEEQQRKEREKEEEENQKRNVITNNTVFIDLRPMLRNRRIRSEKNRRFVEVGVSKSVVPEIEAVVVVGEAINDQGEKIAELKNQKNQKKKNKGKRGKPRAKESLIEGTTQLPPEKVTEDEIPVAVTERNGEKVALNGEGSEKQPEGKEIPVIVTGRKGGREGNGRGIKRNERNSTVNRKIWEKKTLVDRSVETELKFEGLTVNGGTIENEEPVMENNGGHLKHNSGNRRYNHPKVYRSVQTELKFEDLTLNGGTIGNEEPVMENDAGHLKHNSGNRRYNHPKSYRSVQTELKFEGLTLNGGTIGNEEPVMENNGGHSKYNSGYKRYNRPKEWKPRDCNLVWVKRGEISDADATGIQSSGSLAKVKA